MGSGHAGHHTADVDFLGIRRDVSSIGEKQAPHCRIGSGVPLHCGFPGVVGEVSCAIRTDRNSGSIYTFFSKYS